MKLLKKMAGLAALAGLVGFGSTAQAQIQGAGSLFVNLTANDVAYTTGSTQTSWVNHGTAGGTFAQTAPRGAATAPNPVTITAQGVARGFFFNNTNPRGDASVANNTWNQNADNVYTPDAMLASVLAPAGISGTSDFSVEAWYYNPTNDTEETFFSVGDRPTNVMQLGAANPTYVGYGSGGGDRNFSAWGGSTPSAAAWHYYAVTYTGASGSPANAFVLYIDGARQPTTLTEMITTHAGAATENLPAGATMSVGMSRTFAIRTPDAAESAGWNGAFNNPTTLIVNRIRVWDNVLTDAQVVNNYLFERPDFFTVPLIPPPPSITWRYPVSGKVVELGEPAVASGAFTFPIDFRASISPLNPAPLNITGYEIQGPDAGMYAFATTPSTGSLVNLQSVKFLMRHTPTGTAQTSAALVLHTSIGDKRILLRTNVARLYVDGLNGADGNPGTLAQPFATLNKAITVAGSGAVIEVKGIASGYAGIGTLTNADRAFRMVGNGTVTLLGGPNLITANAPNTAQVAFENFAVASAGGNALSTTGTGNYEIKYTNCNLSNTGTAVTATTVAGGQGSPVIARVLVNGGTYLGVQSGTSTSNNALRSVGTLSAELVVSNANLSGSYQNVTFLNPGNDPTTVSLTNCNFGSVPGYRARIGLQASGTVVTTRFVFKNCNFDGFIDSAYAGNAVPSPLSFANCTFAHGGTGAHIYNNGATLTTLTDVNMTSGGAGMGYFGAAGARMTLKNLTITDQATNAINIGGSNATTLTLTNSSIEGGKSTLGATASALNVTGSASFVTIDRSTLRGGKLDAVRGGKTSNPISVVKPSRFTLTNSVIEGGQYGVLISRSGNAVVPVITFNNDTMIDTQDSTHPSVGINLPFGVTATVKNSIIKSYDSVTSGSVTLSNSLTSTATATAGTDPHFRNPSTFATPVTVGVSDYHLTGISALATGQGVAIPGNTVDRDGIARATPPAIGAYEFNAAANAVNLPFTYFR